MKKSTLHILYAWALLLCFATGQYMVYAHQHNQIKNVHASSCHDCKSSTHTIVKEKCEVCDSMHHVAMDLSVSVAYMHTLITTTHTFKSPVYDFTSIALILAAGRAPPVVS
ncbi:hypothetical protein [Mucilaginibacter psychrotolerans]|uniref:Uncharacterized protein n=1 Tax=Mucilaginibacter psychrotolerans TaxID=1524096 RepID=A0A4Y8SMY3_9SPHI|nr:hypothetical protein [Mucilaginibacter psychrotolerans]TFF40403.1 hypothetical protein E2R66_03915 [Mucilaginibacter psychrotolerans]